MADEPDVPDRNVARRARLLPEEEAAGSDDPRAQAEAILAESEQRIASRHAAPGSFVERRRSDEATPPA
jgi:hypothetical protein